MDTRPNILLVDDDPLAIAVLARMLGDHARLRFAKSGEEALRLARRDTPTLMLLDVEMPGLNGFDVCAMMKQEPCLRDIPVIFITSHDGTAQEVAGLEVGAVDFISKPPNGPLVLARVRTQLRLKQMTDALREAAVVDSLTQVANRRHFDESLAREWPRALRARAPLTVIMIDVDHFKAFNDHYGHQAGDEALKAVAHALRTTARRPADVLARYGGEEFVLLAPDVDGQGALTLATRLLDCVEDLALPHAASPVADHITVSLGVSSFDEGCEGWQSGSQFVRSALAPVRYNATDLVQVADRALYGAKQAGRRRAVRLPLDTSLRAAGSLTPSTPLHALGEYAVSPASVTPSCMASVGHHA